MFLTVLLRQKPTSFKAKYDLLYITGGIQKCEIAH